MAAASDITIYDGQPTPVLRTFTPARKSGDVVFWEERTTASTPLGFARIGIGQSKAKATSPVIRTKCTLVWPYEVLDSDTGVYSYKDVYGFKGEFIVPVAAVYQQRDDAFSATINLFAHAVLRAAVADVDPPY